MNTPTRGGDVAGTELITPAPAWLAWSPRPGLSPEFRRADSGTAPPLGIAGTGDPHVFGWWSRAVPVNAGSTYRIRARMRVSGIDDLRAHLLTAVAWLTHPGAALKDCPQDYLDSYGADPDHPGQVTATATLQAPSGATSAQLLLVLRGTGRGLAEWHSLTLAEVPALPHRRAEITVTQGGPAAAEGNLTFWNCVLDGVPATTDLVCLPECMNKRLDTAVADFAEPLFGPTYDLLAQHARRLRAYVCGCYYERDDDLIFNTAVLVNRSGGYVGHYRKVHPYWPEVHAGVSPGDQLATFDTDFGRIGIMTCYDSWFPESARILGLLGAELIVFPNAGHEPRIMPARAIDNNVYLASASLHGPSVVVDTLGGTVATAPEGGIASATVDLTHRPTPHPNAGGRLNASPGGQRELRHAMSDRLFQEIMQAHRQCPADGSPADVS